MRKEERQIILSLSDLLRAIKEGKEVIYFCAALLALLFFFYLLFKPISYTAEGIFKGQGGQQSSTFSKALQLLGEGESYSSYDDPRSFLTSYPVMKRVVHTLSLQCHLSEKRRFGRIKEVWNRLKLERHFFKFRSKIPTCLPLADLSKPLRSISCDYSQELPTSVQIQFLNDTEFQVKKGRQNVGVGTVGHPFEWSEGTLTVDASGTKGKKYYLTLIPLDLAIENLRKCVKIQRDKQCSSLTNISITHRDRHLAAAIVNVIMEAFQDYLKSEGKRKITQQLGYLNQRQKEAMGNLESVMEEHKTYLKSHLDAGEMITYDTELGFIAQKQSVEKQRLQAIELEMDQLYQAIYNQSPPPLEDLLFTLHTNDNELLNTLSLESAKSLLYEHQKTLDQNRLDNERYDYCLIKLEDPGFDCSSLSKTLQDPTLRERFEKIHALHRNLIDEKNWSESEQNHLREEIETEKQFLIRHINNLKEGTTVHQEVLTSRIHSLQETLLNLYLKQYAQTEKSMVDLAKEAMHFPEKWFTEEKISINTKIYTEIINSIVKIVEAKNIGYNLEYLVATPLKESIPPIVPNRPHLLLGFAGGSVCGIFLALMILSLRQVWLGPSASAQNLSVLGKTVCKSEEMIDASDYFLSKQGPVVLFSYKEHSHFLIQQIESRNENIYLLPIKDQLIHDVEFEENLSALKKNYDRIFLLLNSPAQSFRTKKFAALSDAIIFCVTDERLHEIAWMGENTLYIVKPFTPKKMALFEIIPLLTKLTLRTFSPSSFFVQNFFAKRS